MDTSVFMRQGKYLMLALDHRGSFKKLLNPEDPGAVQDAQVIGLKERILRSLKDQFSGVLLDPVFGLPAYKKVLGEQDGSPYVLSLEESGYEEREGDRYSKLQYEAKQLKEWGASGTKLLLYFDPQGKSAEHQVDVAKTALEASRGQAIPFFLEVVTYGKGRDFASAGEATLQAMRMLLSRGVKPDVWKLEFPGSAELAKEITKLSSDTPWILLTRGASFEQFAEELQTSIENGARGFLAGRAVWQELMDFSGAAQEQFLSETVPQRFREISQIALHA